MLTRLRVTWFSIISCLRAITVFFSSFQMRSASRARIEKTRHERLQKILRHAQDNIPYYRDYFGSGSSARASGSSRAADSGGPLTLTQFPPVDKKLMMERYAEFVSDPQLKKEKLNSFVDTSGANEHFYLGKYVVCTTSGSSGLVGFFVYDSYAWGTYRSLSYSRFFSYRFSLRGLTQFLKKGRFRWAMLIALRKHNVTYQLSAILPAIFRFFVQHRYFSVLVPIKQNLEGLEEFAPDLIHGYPTALAKLAEEQIAGRVRLAPRFVTSSSEPLTDDVRGLILGAFPKAELIEAYGATELPGMAHECEFGNLHINEDYCLLEPVDKNYNPVAAATASDKMLLTSFVSFVQPIIRYELNDSAIISGPGCRCGSTHLCLTVLGRTEDTFHLLDESGQFLSLPPKHFHLLFFKVKSLQEYQIIHSFQNQLQIRFRVRAGFAASAATEDVRAVFEEYFSIHGLSKKLQVSYEAVNEIPRDPQSQKIKVAISQVPAPTQTPTKTSA